MEPTLEFTDEQRAELQSLYPAIEGWAIATDGHIHFHTMGATKKEAIEHAGFYDLELFEQDSRTFGGMILVPVRVQPFPDPK